VRVCVRNVKVMRVCARAFSIPILRETPEETRVRTARGRTTDGSAKPVCTKLVSRHETFCRPCVHANDLPANTTVHCRRARLCAYTPILCTPLRFLTAARGTRAETSTTPCANKPLNRGCGGVDNSDIDRITRLTGTGPFVLTDR
jgi:hypothetical protein